MRVGGDVLRDSGDKGFLQHWKRFLAALEDCSRAEAVSKKLKMERIVAQAMIWVQKEDVAQERVRMAAMHAFFMPGCSMSVGDDGR
jgi:hypothetical protein